VIHASTNTIISIINNVRSGFMTLPPVLLEEQPVVVLLLEGFDLLVASYWWTQWTWRFMWFGSSERNTLHPRKNWVVLLKPALPEPYLFLAYLSTPVKRRLPEPFIAQGQAVTLRPGARQVAPRWLKPYTASSVIMDRSSKWCLARRQQRGVIMSYRSAALNMV
jgi:hypothetical protein